MPDRTPLPLVPGLPGGAAVRLATALNALRNIEGGRHSLFVAGYAAAYAPAIKDERITQDFLAHLKLVAAAHDIGKIGISDEILLKPSRLTDGEMSIVRAHVTSGSTAVEELIKDLDLENWPYVGLLRGIVLSHHEHFDGSGYPHGLRGQAIPFGARIVAIADVFDALTTGRPYKRAWEAEEAVSYISRQNDQQFDALCVRAFIERFPQILEVRRAFSDRLPSARGV